LQCDGAPAAVSQSRERVCVGTRSHEYGYRSCSITSGQLLHNPVASSNELINEVIVGGHDVNYNFNNNQVVSTRFLIDIYNFRVPFFLKKIKILNCNSSITSVATRHVIFIIFIRRIATQTTLQLQLDKHFNCNSSKALRLQTGTPVATWQALQLQL
jgi:hypothetical protein